MDADLIKVVNKLQDTFHNLGMLISANSLLCHVWNCSWKIAGGELDMPQFAFVSDCLFYRSYS